MLKKVVLEGRSIISFYITCLLVEELHWQLMMEWRAGVQKVQQRYTERKETELLHSLAQIFQSFFFLFLPLNDMLLCPRHMFVSGYKESFVKSPLSFYPPNKTPLTFAWMQDLYELGDLSSKSEFHNSKGGWQFTQTLALKQWIEPQKLHTFTFSEGQWQARTYITHSARLRDRW